MAFSNQAFFSAREAVFAAVDDRFARLAGIMKKRAHYRAVFRRSRAELIGLSDRELADVGIARSNINYVAKQAAEMAVNNG